MTGFASLTREDEAVTVSVTARSVNHRYLDLQIHLPQSLLRLEPRVRELAQGRLARGRVEIRVTARRRNAPPVQVDVDEGLVAALVEAAGRPDVVRATGGKWTVGELLGFPRVLTIAERTAESEADPDVDALVAGAVGDALEELDRMRASEGAHLRGDLDGRLAALVRLVDRVEGCAADSAETLAQRLTARLAEIGPDVQADQAALAQEIVRFVARSDIHEEIARLRAHVSHWSSLADGPEPCGRKLDFLLQEMNREVNTIGSKADGQQTPELVVAAKAELEKLREQAQNVE
jgi:uncharacterized protein (TIGR00255 family)